MDLQLKGKHVLITGGSKGIGLACAHVFLEEGARVSLVSRSEGKLLESGQALRVAWPHAGERIATFAADLKDPNAALAALDAAEAAMGAVDVLVNSAGAALMTAPDDLQAQSWHDAMDVSHMAGGAANAALMLVTAGMAAAYGPKGVRVNAVNPGLTLTERLKVSIAAGAKLANISEEEALKRANDRLPLGRVARPDEIANAVAFLASDKASYITGAILSMDGAVTPMVV